MPEREKFILKQYWLAQVISYLIYDSAGPKGIIFLRAFLLTAMLLIAFWRLKRWQVSFYISFISLFFLYLNALQFIGERPVLFTILFTPLTFFILEDFRCKKDKRIFLLLPLMLLWANLHGGFVIGGIIIAVFMFGEVIKIIFKKSVYTKNEKILFYSATIIALGASYINPTGWEAFHIALSHKYKFLEQGIHEYYSPFFLYINKLSPVNYGYVTLAFMFPLILILRNKKIDLIHIILLSGFFIIAAKTGRYTIYYSSIAAMILGRETDMLQQDLFKRISNRTSEKLITVFTAAVLLSAIFFFVGIFRFNLKFDLAKGSNVPGMAVDFIEKNKLSGNIFNADPYGGYLTWRLYPWKKNFIDTRWLNHTVQVEYRWMIGAVESVYNEKLPEGKSPLWKRLLDNYNINIILFDTMDAFGNVPKLLLTLIEDEDWVPVYSDFISVIFVRNVPKNQDVITKFKQTKENVYSIVIGIGTQMAIYDGLNPQYLLSLGKTFCEMGRFEDALKAYQYALKRRPEDAMITDKITQVESELRKEHKE